MIAGVQGQVELGEDAADVGLDRLAAEVFPTAAGIALWAVAAGIGLLLRRGATAATPRGGVAVQRTVTGKPAVAAGSRRAEGRLPRHTMTVWVRAMLATQRLAVVLVRAMLWTQRRAAAWVRAMLSTRRRRRAVVIGLLVLTSPIWAAAATRSRPVAAPPPPPVPPQLVAAITTARPAGYPVGGIDISSHDHRHFSIQWRVEVAAGTHFVYVKATEGTTYVNPHFGADYTAAKAARRYVGAYVYARPDLGDPVGQAEHFLRHARFSRDARTLVPFVDLEWPYLGVGTGPCYNLSPAEMRAWIHAFVDRIEAGIHRKPMIYTNANWWNPCTGNDPSFGGYPLDIADYTNKPPKLPAGWTTFALWQYRPGNPEKRGDHDRDVINGGMTGLAALAWPRKGTR